MRLLKNPALSFFCLFFCLASLPASAKVSVSANLESVVGSGQQGAPVSEAHRSAFLENELNSYLQSCKQSMLIDESMLPIDSFRYLSVTQDNGDILIMVMDDDDLLDNNSTVYSKTAAGLTRHFNCGEKHITPILALVNELPVDEKVKHAALLPKRAMLTSYEPNIMSTRMDDNDINAMYLDFKVSLKYPVFHDGYFSDGNDPLNLYLAFSGRLSQYIETDISSPVVGRRFNPKLFSRYVFGDGDDYVDIGYNHESNGQSIVSPEGLAQKQQELGPTYDILAREFISRGWDYWSVDVKKTFFDKNSRYGELSTYLNLHYYVSNGILQGKPEEYNTWEDGGMVEKPRSEYDGITFLARWDFPRDFCMSELLILHNIDLFEGACAQKIAWQHKTGYDKPFENTSNLLELTVDLWGLPVMFWGQTGYNNDFVDYYRNVNSWGIALELNTF